MGKATARLIRELGAKHPAENYFLKNGTAESDNILTELQDVLLYLIPQLNKFPRDQKFMLGDRIEIRFPEPGGGGFSHHKGTQ